MIYAVILAGGKGERFWPISRSGIPKQLLKITSEKNMLQETMDRVKDFIPQKQTMIVTGSNIKSAILKESPSLKEDSIIVEPQGKNTCLAIGLAAIHLRKKDPDAAMAVLSCDHLIEPRERLIETLKLGLEITGKDDFLVTIGVIPTRPETAYGYIELADLYDKYGQVSVYKVKQFKEKPDRMVAQEYYFDRKHLWNSGMFIWKVDSIMKALERHMPQLHRSLMEHYETVGTKREKESLSDLYSRADDISIDYAVLEKADNVLCIRADMIWDDVGSWLALDRIKQKDSDGNVIIGNSLAVDSYETVVYNDGDGIILTMGISDMVVVRSGEIVFVAHKTKIPEIKELLRKLGENKDLRKYL